MQYISLYGGSSRTVNWGIFLQPFFEKGSFAKWHTIKELFWPESQGQVSSNKFLWVN